MATQCAANPALTIMALAARLADRIVRGHTGCGGGRTTPHDEHELLTASRRASVENHPTILLDFSSSGYASEMFRRLHPRSPTLAPSVGTPLSVSTGFGADG
jgi:hypothetical protein